MGTNIGNRKSQIKRSPHHFVFIRHDLDACGTSQITNTFINSCKIRSNRIFHLIENSSHGRVFIRSNAPACQPPLDILAHFIGFGSRLEFSLERSLRFVQAKCRNIKPKVSASGACQQVQSSLDAIVGRRAAVNYPIRLDEDVRHLVCEGAWSGRPDVSGDQNRNDVRLERGLQVPRPLS